MLAFPLRPDLVADVIDDLGEKTQVDDLVVHAECGLDLKGGAEVPCLESGGRRAGGQITAALQGDSAVLLAIDFDLLGHLRRFVFRWINVFLDRFAGRLLSAAGNAEHGFEDAGLAVLDECGDLLAQFHIASGSLFTE